MEAKRRRSGHLLLDPRGVTAMEYALLAATLAIIIVGTLSAFGSQFASGFASVDAALTTQGNAAANQAAVSVP